jgi:Zn-dependent protease
MKWSWKLGSPFGIDVHVHASFLLLLAWVGFGAYSDTRSPLAVIVSVLFVSALFCLVVMHEYGHALTARHFGIRTQRITLYPIGGVAMLQSMPTVPREQLLIALAGPAVNYVLAGLIAGALALTGTPLLSLRAVTDQPAALASGLFWANIVMGSFNLLPALPMDGGRVLRAVLAMRTDELRATSIAASVAKLLALLMFGYAMYSGTAMLAVIAVVVWIGSNAERRMAEHQAYADLRAGYAAPPTGGPYNTVVESEPSPDVAAAPAARRFVRVPHARGRSAFQAVIEIVQGPDGPRLRYRIR